MVTSKQLILCVRASLMRIDQYRSITVLRVSVKIAKIGKS